MFSPQAPEIAYELIMGEYMDRKHCQSFGSIWRHTTWRVSSKLKNNINKADFSVKTIKGTNTYLVSVKKEQQPTQHQYVCDTKVWESIGCKLFHSFAI